MLSISVPAFVSGVVSGQPMHIPDGYLGPWFAMAMWVVSLVILGLSISRFGRRLSQRMVPLVALFAAFSFVIMMFNVPLVGGTTGHAVGATIAAIILGPEGATIAVAIVEFTSPYTTSQSGRCSSSTGSKRSMMRAVCCAWLPEPTSRFTSGAGIPRSRKKPADIASS